MYNVTSDTSIHFISGMPFITSHLPFMEINNTSININQGLMVIYM